MTPIRIIPPSPAFYRDLLLVVMVAVILVLVATYRPKVETIPHQPPSDSRWEPRPLPR